MHMQFFDNPQPSEWNELLRRPSKPAAELRDTVSSVVNDVRRGGDVALRAYEQRFDGVALDSLRVSDEEIVAAENAVSSDLKQAIAKAYSNIRCFHEAQRFSPIRVETCPGVTCWQKAVPIERVGLYIPGGTAPLFSTVLMLAVPAQIAGCRDIVLCTPPVRCGHGEVNPVVLYAAHLAGVTSIFKLGGAQAIAAMAYGSESVPRVFKIFGPGNQYVVAAKQLVSLDGVAIDMPAGPSEVEVIADSSSHPDFVAADLLSQAEHGGDSQVLLVATDCGIISAVESEIERQLALLPRRDIAAEALSHSKAVLVSSREAVVEITNAYAPEHLVVATDDASEIAQRITAAGSIFLGHYSCESAGDYASGTNHTLPTGGHAHAYSGLSLDSFMRKLTLQRLTPDGVREIGAAVSAMAEAEGLHAHQRAMTIRMEYLKGKFGEN